MLLPMSLLCVLYQADPRATASVGVATESSKLFLMSWEPVHMVIYYARQRHNIARSMIANALRGQGYNVYEEVHDLSNGGSNRRIDVIAFKPSCSESFIIDPTIRFEANETQPEEVDAEKRRIYEETVDFYKEKYKFSSISVIGMMLGARGIIPKFFVNFCNTFGRTRSNDTQLTLNNMEPSMSGRYSCEVSADAPSFHTSLVSGDLEVVASINREEPSSFTTYTQGYGFYADKAIETETLSEFKNKVPYDRPAISGVRTRYRLGDKLRSNCSSSWSRPAAKLTWLVNDVQASPHQLVHYPIRREADSDRESSQLGLQLLVKPHHFETGRLKIRCIASIHDVYWQSTEKSVEEDRPKGIKLGAVGPEFVPNIPEPSTAHPRLRNNFYDDYEDVEKPTVPIASAGSYFRRWRLVWVTPLMLSLLTVIR